MDVDDLSNITDNATSDQVYTHRESFYERLFLELFTLVGLVSVAANVLIIFVVVKYKKLRKDVTNVLIAHMSLLHGVYLVATPLTLRVFSMVDFSYPLHYSLLCAFTQVEYSVVVAIYLFMFLLLCDWYLKLYCEVKYLKFCRVYKFLVIAIYVCVILLCSVSVPFCFKTMLHFALDGDIVFLVFIALVIVVVVMNIIHTFKKKKLLLKSNSPGLVIVNLFVILWIPSLTLLLLAIAGIHQPLAVIFFVTVALSSPILNFLYLFYYDNNYNIFLKKVFKCQCNDYSNDALDDQPVVYSDASGVEISKS